MEHKTSYGEYIQDLTKRLQVYLKLGGSLYVPTKQNPNYDRLRQAKRLAKDAGIENPSFESIYADCGIKFDRNYQVFKEFTDGLSKVADDAGYVDVIKTSNANAFQTRLRSYLNTHSKEAGISPGEYLVLMTDFRYKNMVISGDYVGALQDELNAAYPNGVVKGIKQHNPSLYYKLEHFIKYSPSPISFEDALSFFGLSNGNTRPTPKGTSPEDIKLQEEQALKTLSTLYPNGQVENLVTTDRDTYFDVVRAARRHDCTPKQWLSQYGFNYPAALDVARLSKITVNAKAHEHKLLGMREEFLKDYDLQNADEVDMFNINFEIACKIGKVLYGEKNQNDCQNLQTSTQEEFIAPVGEPLADMANLETNIPTPQQTEQTPQIDIKQIQETAPLEQ